MYPNIWWSFVFTNTGSRMILTGDGWNRIDNGSREERLSMPIARSATEGRWSRRDNAQASRRWSSARSPHGETRRRSRGWSLGRSHVTRSVKLSRLARVQHSNDKNNDLLFSLPNRRRFISLESRASMLAATGILQHSILRCQSMIFATARNSGQR